MRIVKFVSLFVFFGALALMAVPSMSEAACACSGIGQSNGFYANPSPYGGYGPGYGYPAQFQTQPVRPKYGKSKKRAPKPKPAAQ